MYISNITPPQVWSASSRSLTNFGSSALAIASSASTSLAAATSVDLRPSLGIVGVITAAVITGVGATSSGTVQSFDGSQVITLSISALGASQSTGFTAVNTNVNGVRVLNNDASVAGRYQSAQYLMTI